jgi:hypothetical protein
MVAFLLPFAFEHHFLWHGRRRNQLSVAVELGRLGDVRELLDDGVDTDTPCEVRSFDWVSQRTRAHAQHHDLASISLELKFFRRCIRQLCADACWYIYIFSLQSQTVSHFAML